MRGALRVLLLASLVQCAASWLELFGAPELHKPAARGRATVIEGVEHKKCGSRRGRCQPAGGCEVRMARCVPRIGHYWQLEPPPASNLPDFLARLVRPPPPYATMTEKGVVIAEPGYWFTTYRFKDGPADAGADTLPGLTFGYMVAWCVALPAAVALLAYVLYTGDATSGAATVDTARSR